MWVRKSSIQSVPEFARLDASSLEAARTLLLDEEDDEETQARLDETFERFSALQPALAAHLSELLERPYHEVALALAYFLGLSIFLAFEYEKGHVLRRVLPEELLANTELLHLDESLRAGDPKDQLATDDVVALQQPAIVRFLHEQFEAALDGHQDIIAPSELEQVYGTLVLLTLSLSYAVRPPAGYPLSRTGLSS